MFQKYIHQIWYQGINNIPNKYIEYRKTWINNYSEYQFKIWDKNKIEKFIKSEYPCYLNRYNSYNYFIQKIDYAKILILYHYGGIYCDMDTISLKNMGDLLPLKNEFIIISKLKTYFPEKLVLKIIGYKFNDFCNNGIIISSHKHPFWIYFINEMNNINLKKYWIDNLFNGIYVYRTTGPLVLSESLFRYNKKNNENINLIDYDKLEPLYGMDYSSILNSKKEGYCQHFHSLSWLRCEKLYLNRLINIIISIYFTNRRYWQCFVIICLFVLYYYLK